MNWIGAWVSPSVSALDPGPATDTGGGGGEREILMVWGLPYPELQVVWGPSPAWGLYRTPCSLPAWTHHVLAYLKPGSLDLEQRIDPWQFSSERVLFSPSFGSRPAQASLALPLLHIRLPCQVEEQSRKRRWQPSLHGQANARLVLLDNGVALKVQRGFPEIFRWRRKFPFALLPSFCVPPFHSFLCSPATLSIGKTRHKRPTLAESSLYYHTV